MCVLLSRACALALVLAAAGCGGGATPDRPDEPARLLLDATPNAVHAGIYLARSRGYDLAEGVELAIRTPRARTNPRRLLETGRVDLAILDIADFARRREQGAPLIGVMAVLQHERGRPEPAWPPLVLVATRDTVQDRRALVRATIRTLQRGYTEAASDPASAVSVMADAVRGLDREALAADLDTVAPAFTGGARVYGRLVEGRLRAWHEEAVRTGALSRRLDLDAAFDTTLVGAIRTE